MDVALNWLWQGGIVALATAAILRLIPRSRADARYRVVYVAYLAVLALPAVPLLASLLAPVSATGLTTAVPPVAMPVAWWTSGAAALAAWMLWAAGSAWRTATAMLALRRARRTARDLPADLEARLRHWQRLRRTGRRARLARSDGMGTAGVLGGRTPVIGISPLLLQQLDESDLDRVVIHEWAHVQRRDDVAQVGVRLMRAVVGWHPAVWWLERQLHVEREVACDEMAVTATGCAKAYATCLTTLAALAPARAGVPALGVVSASGLRQRVTRIVALGHSTPARASRLTPLAGAAAVTVLAVLVGHVEIVGAIADTGRRVATVAEQVLAVVPQVQPLPLIEDATMSHVVGAASPAPPAPSPSDPEQVVEVAAAEPAAPAAALASRRLPLSSDAVALPAPAAGAAASIDTPPPPAAAAEPGVRPLWEVAADAGKAVGAGSGQAAAATAGFFTRVGKQVARSF